MRHIPIPQQKIIFIKHYCLTFHPFLNDINSNIFEIKRIGLFYSNYMSKGNKSSALWNITDPDDPYDIKKSMIARLPDHPSKPMGQFLDLVCLLQAAEIERLTDYLTEMKSKYREVERRQLDRHSYEVQIKELAQKNITLTAVKSQCEKLKDYIRRQAQELQQLQKKNLQSVNLQTLQAKYDGLLNQLRVSRDQNEKSEKTVAKLNIEIGEWRSRCERFEIQKRSSSSQFEFQLKQRISIEIRTIRQEADERFRKQQGQIKQLRESIETKNQQIQMMITHKDQLSRQIRLLEQKNRNRGNVQESINDKNREIQRLNILLSQKTLRLEQTTANIQKIGGQMNIIEQKYRGLQRERQGYILRLKQIQIYKARGENVDKMQQKVAMMSMEIERLNGINAIRARQCAQVNAENDRLKTQLRGWKEQTEKQRQLIVKLQTEMQLLSANQSRVHILTQQIDRVNILLKNKTQQLYSLQQKVNINQINATQLGTLATQKSRLQQELQAARTELRNYKTITESQINSLKTENNKLKSEFEQNHAHRIEGQKYRLEIDRGKAQLQKSKGQLNILRRNFEQEKSNSTRLLNQRNRLFSENQSMLGELIHLKKEIEGLKVMIRTIQQKDRQLQIKSQQLSNLQMINANLRNDYDNINQRNQRLQVSVDTIYKQIQRLHTILATKVNQHQKLVKDYSQLEEKCRFMESKVNNSTNEKEYFEKEISKMTVEIEAFRRTNNEGNINLTHKINVLTLDKEKCEHSLLQKDKLIGQYLKQKDALERKLIEAHRELSIKVSSEDQLKIEKQRFYFEISARDTTIAQLQAIIKDKENSSSNELEGKVKMWENKVNEWQNRLREAENGLQIRKDQNERLKKQNERLIIQLQKMTVDYQQINRHKETIIQENYQIKRRVQQLSGERSTQDHLKLQIKMAQQALMRERKQSESLRTKIKNLQQALFRQGKQVQTSKDTIKEYQMKIVHIESTQTRVLQERIKEYQLKYQQQESLVINQQRQIKQIENQLSSFLNRDRQTITNLETYQQKISLLSIEIERLNIMIQDKSKQCRDKEGYIQNLTIKLNQNKDNREAIEKIRQLQNKTKYYAGQIERLNVFLQQNTRQIHQKDVFIQNLTVKLNQQNQQPNTKQTQIIEKYKIQIANLKIALEQYQNINLHTIAERDELFKMSHQLKDQLDEQAYSFGEEEKKWREESRRFGQELGFLRKKEQTFITKIEQYQRIINNKNDQRVWKSRISELEHYIEINKNQINSLKIQNANSQTAINELMNINQELNIKLGQTGIFQQQLIKHTTKIRELMSQMQQKQQQLIGWQQKYNSLYSAYQILYNNYHVTKSEYEVTIVNLKADEAKLYKLEEDYQAIAFAFRKKEQEIYDLKIKMKGDGDLYQKNLILSKEIDRITELNRMLQIQIADVRLRLTDNTSLNKRIQQQLALMVVLFAEIQSMRSRLISSQRQCQQVRRSSIIPSRVDKNKP